jgi:hypothetical protein
MHNLADARPFYVVHATIAFIAAGRPASAMRLTQALPSTHGNESSSLSPEDALAAPLCESLLAFARSDYAACVEWLKRVRHIAHRCGGSLAQCDVIHLTFTEAALRARQACLARALVAERAAQKPASQLNQLLQQRLAQPGDLSPHILAQQTVNRRGEDRAAAAELNRRSVTTSSGKQWHSTQIIRARDRLGL